MRTLIAIVTGLCVGSVTAAEFAHPDAEAVALQGAGKAQICHYNTDFPKPNWICYERTLYGARVPLVIALPKPGPVVVRNSAWAFALEECQEGELVLNIDTVNDKRSHRPPPMPSLDISGSFAGCSTWVPLEPGQPMK